MIPPLARFPRFLVKTTIKSLRESPEDWTLTSYYARNAALALEISGTTGLFALTISTKEGYTYGGVTFISVFFGWLTWRTPMRRALVDLQIRRYMIAQERRFND